jgi:hypothetical protein
MRLHLIPASPIEGVPHYGGRPSLWRASLIMEGVLRYGGRPSLFVTNGMRAPVNMSSAAQLCCLPVLHFITA